MALGSVTNMRNIGCKCHIIALRTMMQEELHIKTNVSQSRISKFLSRHQLWSGNEKEKIKTKE